MNTEELYSTIEDYVNNIKKNQIVQGDDLWKQVKKYRVGGSTLASIMDVGFNKLPDMLLVPKKFTGDIKTAWGTVFEDVLMKYIEISDNTIVLGDGIFIEHNEYICYSPDGLCVMNIKGVMKRVLIEMKCPFNRIPCGGVPKYYIPQVKMGLDIIPVADSGMYIEAVFRKCSYEQLSFSKEYDYETYNQSFTGAGVIACGIIGFYTFIGMDKTVPIDIGTSSCPKELFEHVMMDTASGNGRIFNDVFDIITDECIDINYSVAVCMSNIQTYAESCGGNLVYYMPWKLLRVDYHGIKKDIGYLDRWQEKIKDYCETIKISDSNPLEKNNIIQQFINKYYVDPNMY